MSFPRYPEYKDSGVEWLGEVPAHWDVLALKRDLSFLTSGSRGWAEHYADEGAVFIRIGNLTRDRISLDLSDIQYVDIPDGAEGERTRVQPGDVLFSITAYLGSVAVVPDGIDNAYVSQHVALARISGRRFLSEWVAYSALSIVGKTYLETQGYGGTKIQLGLDDIANLIVMAPSISEQRIITDFIGRETAKIDALIAEQEHLIALLKEKRQAVISHAVTKGLYPDVPMRESGVEWLGQVPAHWVVRRVGTLFGEAIEQGNDDLPILSVSIHDGVSDRQLSDDEMDRKVTRSEDTSKYKRVQPQDLVYNMMRAWQGGFGCVATKGMVSPAYVVARPKVKVQTKFIELLLRTGLAVEEMRRRSQGVTDFRLRLYWDEFKTMSVCMPTIAEQDQILSWIDQETQKFDALTDVATSAITLLQERRSALISAAVTGKIDVRGLAVPSEVAA